MKVGIPLFLLRPERVTDAAIRADELGFESIWFPEHLVFPTEIKSAYPYSVDGQPPINPATPLLDPMVLLGHIAARTSRIRLGTNVYLMPLRHPITVARMAMTVDLLSNGRLSLGLGAGWLQEEFDAAGVDFATRAGRLREGIRAMRALWTESEPEFHGRHFDFGPLKFEPKPVQKPHPPLIVGGETNAALKRAAELGDGWYGVGHTPDSAATQVARLRELLRDAGRADASFEYTVSCGLAAVTRDGLRRYEDAGIDRIVVLPWRNGREAHDKMAEFADEIGLSGV